jgi:hypothetical protein
MHLVEGFVLRKTLDEWVAVPCGQSALRMSGLVSMNETGAFLFSALQQEHTEDTLRRLLLDNYATDEETAAQDVRYFVEYLRQNNLLVEE